VGRQDFAILKRADNQSSPKWHSILRNMVDLSVLFAAEELHDVLRRFSRWTLSRLQRLAE
jgi:hypothetical protein